MIKDKILSNMQEVINGCMGEDIAACVTTCPMHTDAKKYIDLIRQEKGEESIKVIREKLFIPGTLGRICAHPCEAACKWNEGKSPMAIASLKRYAADNFDNPKNWDVSIGNKLSGKKVAIIGAGPSGLQAAIDLRKEGANITIFEKLGVRGGMMAVGIPAYRLPRNLLEKELKYLDMLGVEFKYNVEIGRDISFDDLLDSHDSIVIACGKHLGRIDRSLENSNSKGVFSAADFLREVSLTGKADGVGKNVLVVGGGDVAMDCARSSRRLDGVENVLSICLEDSFDKMPSSNHEIQGSIEEGIKFNHAKSIKSINLDKEGKIKSVDLKTCISMFDEAGRFSPKFDEALITNIKIDTIIFAIGQAVDNEFAPKLLKRPNSTFECDKNTLQSPSLDKVFIAGDASGESVIVIQAMATGRRAAESVKRYLLGEDLNKDRKLKETSSYETKLDMPTDWSKIQERRLGMQELDPEIRIKSFEEVGLGFTKEEALKEASRCRKCECKLCMKECIMLNDYTECPKTLFQRYIDEGLDEVDNMIAYSCNECKQCTLKCPKDYDLRDVFTDLKSLYAEENDGIVPLPVLLDSDRLQIKESSEEYCISVSGANKTEKKEKKKTKTKYVFVPGCTVSAYTPEGLENVVKHLKDSLGDENVGALLQCCGKVTRFIGEDGRFEERNGLAIDLLDDLGAEVVITVCPSCYMIYKETCKNQRVISYWDIMHNLIGVPDIAKNIGLNSDVVFNIHDSCVTREISSHHESIRWILDQMGYKWREIEYNKENTRCCGVGGMVCNSNPELYERVYNRRFNDFNQDNVVTYCGSCRGTIQKAGKDSIHILDLLFSGKTYNKKDARERGYKTEEEMWEIRLETKRRFASFSEE